MLIQAVRDGNIASVTAALESGSEDVNQVDEHGATALHYAAENGPREIVVSLLNHGADVNARDGRFGATPAGWAIEYLRPFGAYLAIELDDLAFAIENHDLRWIKRILQRFPGLQNGAYSAEVRFRDLALRSGDADIVALFH